MRRRTEVARKLRVSILEDRNNNLTYRQIQQKRGVSSRTVASLVKGRDLTRFCRECAETDLEKLEEHYPDKVNRPNETITLCGSCHAKVTRDQQRRQNKEKKKELVAPKTPAPPTSLTSKPHIASTYPEVHPLQLRPFTPSEKRWIGKVIWYGGGGFALFEGLLDRKLSPWLRVILAIGGGYAVYRGTKIE